MGNIRMSRQNAEVITASKVLDVNNNTVLLDSSAGIMTITFPAAATSTSIYTLRFEDITNTITIATTGGDTIDTITPVLNAIYTVQSDGVSNRFSTSTAGVFNGSPMSVNAALVNGQGSDVTGLVGRRDKPFATIQAANDALPALGTVHIEDIAIVENVTTVNMKFFLKNSKWTGDLIGGIVFIGGDRAQSMNPDVSGITALFSTSMFIGTVVADDTYVTNINRFDGNVTGANGFQVAMMNVGSVTNGTVDLFGDGTTTPSRCALIGCWNTSVGTLVNAAGDASTADTLEIRGCPKVNCTKLYAGYTNNSHVEISYSKIICDGEGISGVVAGGTANTRLSMFHSSLDITTVNYVFNLTGAGALPGITIQCTEANTIRCGGTHNINWVTDPAGAAVITSKSNMTKSWDGGSGVANDILGQDYVNTAL